MRASIGDAGRVNERVAVLGGRREAVGIADVADNAFDVRSRPRESEPSRTYATTSCPAAA